MKIKVPGVSEKATKAIINWAATNSSIQRCYIFGSRVKGNYRDDSDLDIAIEFCDTVLQNDDSNGLATWINKKEFLQKSIERISEYSIDLEWYHPEQTPKIGKYIRDAGLLIYDKENDGSSK